MALLGSNFTNEVGFRVLLCPLGSNVVVRTACLQMEKEDVVLWGLFYLYILHLRQLKRKTTGNNKDGFYFGQRMVPSALWKSFQISLFLANIHNAGYAYKTVGYNYVKRVPMYYHMKFAFLVWLQLPSVDGAKHLYMSHLRPFFLRHQSRIDQFLGLAYGEMVKLISSHKEEIQYARAVLMKIMGSANQLLKGEEQPRQTNAIEGQRATISDVEPDHVHDD